MSRVRNEVEFQRRKAEIMEGCFAAFAKGGFSGTGIKALAEECGCATATLYMYFGSLDELIVQSTAHVMGKVEAELMARAPKSADKLEAFIDKTPYWTAKKHGASYRLMYQVYTHPKYRESGREFFEGASQRYRAYAEELAPALGIPADVLTGLIFSFVRACVHFALFEDEEYLNAQLAVLKTGIALFMSEAKAA
ncbi:MAG: TetR/AcrR family transcriptional regulator [Coriobacteriales bacterium]